MEGIGDMQAANNGTKRKWSTNLKINILFTFYILNIFTFHHLDNGIIKDVRSLLMILKTFGVTVGIDKRNKIKFVLNYNH